MIDSGSNNNFIGTGVANRLKLKQTPTSSFKVGTGSGAYLLCNSKCEKVTMNIQGHNFVTGLFVLEIKGSDIVLGVQWLLQLGIIKTNYKYLTMQFSFREKEIKLQGEHMLFEVPLKGKNILKLFTTDTHNGFFQLQTVSRVECAPT